MVDFGDTSGKHQWVCPSDRHLALRAKLRTGWSVKTHQLQSIRKPQEPTGLDEKEQAIILEVIRRAERIDLTEQERVGRLVNRVDNMKRNAMGNGTSQCVLCGTGFGLLGSPSYFCNDCRKSVCSKCSIETASSSKDQIWLCKICSETREMWKKSGAWFFKGLPKYVLPEKNSGKGQDNKISKTSSTALTPKPIAGYRSWIRPTATTTSGEAENDSSSEDELMRRSRLNTGASVASAASGVSTTSAGSATSAASGSMAASKSSLIIKKSTTNSTSFSRDSFRRNSNKIKSDRSPTGTVWSDSKSAIVTGPEGSGSKTLPFPVPDKVDSPVVENTQSSNYGGNLVDPGTDGSAFPTQLHPVPAPPSASRPAPCPRQRSPPAPSDTRPNTPQRAYSLRRLPGLPRSWRDWQAAVVPSDEAGASSERMWLPRSVSGHAIPAVKSDDIPTLLGAHGSAQLGSVELSILYDRYSGCLHCRLIRAKGLKSTDINGLADPFCKLNILPVGTKDNRLRTQTISKTCNPEFNESLTFYNISDSDMAAKSLHVLILDDDKYGHDFLGEARIQLCDVPPQHARYFKVFLDNHYAVDNEEAVWGEDIWTRGQILVTLCYSTKRRALIVGIVRCVNLTPMDSNGFSDPFVKLQLKPDSHHQKFKTGIKWRCLNPLFNEEFVFDTKMTELQQQTLVITVWDKDYGKSNDYLGGLELSCLSKGERLRHWVDAIKFPDHKHEGWHHLIDHPFPLA